jgi:hypothetical protein
MNTCVCRKFAEKVMANLETMKIWSDLQTVYASNFHIIKQILVIHATQVVALPL